jgi:hypothetical protein
MEAEVHFIRNQWKSLCLYLLLYVSLKIRELSNVSGYGGKRNYFILSKSISTALF